MNTRRRAINKPLIAKNHHPLPPPPAAELPELDVVDEEALDELLDDEELLLDDEELLLDEGMLSI